MIKKLLLLTVFFFLSDIQFTFAQSAGRESHTENSELRVIKIKWKLTAFDNKLLDKIAVKIASTYSERIVSVIHPDALQQLVVKCTLQIEDEDILQIFRAQGIYDAYFISDQRRYFLKDDGVIHSEPTKEF